MRRRTAWGKRTATGATVAVLTACATQLGSASGQSPTPCDPASPPVFRLVAPSTLPVGFRSGAYLERAGRPDPDGPFRDSLMPVRARFAAEGDGRLEHRYSGGPFNSRDLYDRWPLRFARGDGPARFSVTYGESSRRGPSCRRTLETIIHPRRFRDPGIRLDRPRVRQRIIQIGGVDVRRVSVTVTGTTRRSASRPVRIDGYLGKTIIFLKQARVRDRRLRATAVVKLNAGQALGRITARAQYPGDVRETWPCDDVFTTGSNDDCDQRRSRPR